MSPRAVAATTIAHFIVMVARYGCVGVLDSSARTVDTARSVVDHEVLYQLTAEGAQQTVHGLVGNVYALAHRADFWSNVVSGVLSALLVALLLSKRLRSVSLRLSGALLTPFLWCLGWLVACRPCRRVVLVPYYHCLRNRYGTTEDAYSKEPVGVLDIYVPPFVRFAADRGSVSALAPNRDHDANDRDVRSLLRDREPRRLVILGDPGAGKSLLLQVLAIRACLRDWHELAGVLPVLVRLRDYDPQQGLLLEHIASQVLWPLRFWLPRKALATFLARVPLLLLLDGLDETKGSQTPLVQLRGFLKDCDRKARWRIVLTCRTELFLGSDLSEFEVYEVTELTSQRIGLLVGKYRAKMERRGLSPGQFGEALGEKPADVYRNPLLLTLAIGCYLESRSVPRQLGEFYEQSILRLLTQRDHTAGQAVYSGKELTREQKMLLLQAFTLDRMKRCSASGEDFGGFPVAEFIQRMTELKSGFPELEHVDDLRVDLVVRSGLLKRTTHAGQPWLEFFHRSFFEYCAARQLADQAEDGFLTITQYVDDDKWRLTVVFYCALNHAYAQQLVEVLITTLEDATESEVKRSRLLGECISRLANGAETDNLRRRALSVMLRCAKNLGGERRYGTFAALAMLGKGAPDDFRRELQDSLEELVVGEESERLAEELARHYPDGAVDIFEVLAESPSQHARKAALAGLRTLDKSETGVTGPLWKLCVAPNGTTFEEDSVARAACRQLIEVLNTGTAAVTALNAQARHPQVSPKDSARLYPFDKGHLLGQFLVLVEKLSPLPEQLSTKLNPAWGRLLRCAVEPKEGKKAAQWVELASWTGTRPPFVSGQVFGRIAMGLGAVLGLLSILALAISADSKPLMDQWRMAAVAWVLIGACCALVVWPLWIWWTKAMGWHVEGGAFPSIFGWALLRSREELTLPARLVLVLVRAAVFGAIMLPLFCLAAFLTHPYTSQHTRPVNTAVFTKDGRRLLTSSDDGTVRIWEARTGKQLLRLEHQTVVRSALFTADEASVVTASQNGTVRFWNVSDGTLSTTVQEKDGTLWASPSPGGVGLATASYDRAARIRRAPDDADPIVLCHGSWVTAVQVDPRGRHVLTASKDGAARSWDATNGRLLLVLRHGSWVNSAVYSSDGRRILTASDDGTACTWDAESGDRLVVMKHQKPVRSGSFDQDQDRVVTATADGVVRVWDAHKGALLKEFTADVKTPDRTRFASLSGDGHRVATADGDGAVRVWDADTGKLQTAAVAFWHRSTLGWGDVALWLAFVFAVVFLPSLRFFDQGNPWYLWRRPNHYAEELFDKKDDGIGIEAWLPEQSADKVANWRGSADVPRKPAQGEPTPES